MQETLREKYEKEIEKTMAKISGKLKEGIGNTACFVLFSFYKQVKILTGLTNAHYFI